MKIADAIWMCLPEGMDELFEMVRFERTDQSYDIWLDEKKKLSDEDYRNPDIVARGYTDYVTIQDYPMRGRPVTRVRDKNHHKKLNRQLGKVADSFGNITDI